MSKATGKHFKTIPIFFQSPAGGQLIENLFQQCIQIVLVTPPQEIMLPIRVAIVYFLHIEGLFDYFGQAASLKLVECTLRPFSSFCALLASFRLYPSSWYRFLAEKEGTGKALRSVCCLCISLLQKLLPADTKNTFIDMIHVFHLF